MANTNRKISPKGHASDLVNKLNKKINKFPGHIPDGTQHTPHYVAGEYPGNGWAETFPPSKAVRNKKISNRRKIQNDKQQTQRSIIENNDE